MAKAALALALPALLAVVSVSPAGASASVVNDPKGDQLNSTAPYLDVVHAQVKEQAPGTLLFAMKLAGPIEDLPVGSVLIWPFHVDTASGDVGNPPLYNEYIVRVRWFNNAFQAHLVNRTTGSAEVITFEIVGKKVKAFVQLQDLGNPSSFGWNASTRPGPLADYEDFAPNAPDLATWTA